MAFSAQRLLDHAFAPVSQSYGERDAILYALGVGLGANPLDAGDLAFLLEDRLEVLPTFAVTLGSSGMWVRDPFFEIDWKRLVHSAQSAIFHASPPRAATIVGQSHITEVADRGVQAGAIVRIERSIAEAGSGRPLCTLAQTLLLRGNGGFGGTAPERQRPEAPQGEPAIKMQVSTSSRAALIYRLSGDWNPLHADPIVAAQAGFERPILHGLASYGVAAVHVARALGRGPTDIASLDVRFSGVVYPGDALTFSVWPTREGARFCAHVGERSVLDDGRIAFRSNCP